MSLKIKLFSSLLILFSLYSFTQSEILISDSLKKIKFQSKSILLKNTTPENVFIYIDQMGNTGAHMKKRSMAMMGSKLVLSQLSENAVGLNSKYNWKGRVLGFKMDFTVVTSKWESNKEKVWGTVGEAKMIILEWYQMQLLITKVGEDTLVDLSIKYTKPRKFFFRSIGFILAKPYAKWCLKNMLQDTKIHFESI